MLKDNKNDFQTYISLNYNYIDSVIEVNCKLYIKNVKSILSRFNYVHCGVEVLGMSKRIMNKVFDASLDSGVKIYYQDTDSIHLNYDDVDTVVRKCKGKHGKHLVGEELGNVHIDLPKRKWLYRCLCY